MTVTTHGGKFKDGAEGNPACTCLGYKDPLKEFKEELPGRW